MDLFFFAVKTRDWSFDEAPLMLAQLRVRFPTVGRVWSSRCPVEIRDCCNRDCCNQAISLKTPVNE